MASGRLNMSVLRIRDLRPVFLREFSSKEDLIEAIGCSCFIPISGGLAPPLFKGTYYLDGGIADALPRVDCNTVTVAPFGECVPFSFVYPRNCYFPLTVVLLCF